MSKEHGNLSINSQNIFPIIKKWMYSDHDIFYRELVSNACDAITKLKKLSMIGEYEAPDDIDYKVEIKLSANDKTIKIIDNGIGMTKEEVDEYINQIAFSGAEAFLEKYKDKANDDQIIGHFGLGFYSAFMVADQVTIDTLSFKDGAESVHWSCEGGTEYDISDGTKTNPGTEITLYLNEDSYEFANEYKAKEVLDKYCSFMPVPIFVTNEDAGEQTEEIPEEEVTEKDTVIEHIVGNKNRIFVHGNIFHSGIIRIIHKSIIRVFVITEVAYAVFYSKLCIIVKCGRPDFGNGIRNGNRQFSATSECVA